MIFYATASTGNTTMDIKKYLQRIHYIGLIQPTFEVLSNLQMIHLLNVPFENLDIQNNIKIDLGNLFDKIVVRKRGGFCYELNKLFYELLKQIGFTIKIISARVYSPDKDYYTPEFDHMALIAAVEGSNYLVDVGFGEFSFHPIKIELNKETTDPRGIFKMEAFDGNYIAVKKKNADGVFISEYIFTEKERRIEEFYEMCNYHQTNPASHFMQKTICSLPTENGRITISGDTLKITDSGEVTVRKLNKEQEIQQELWNYFGIKL